ncbi:MAG: PTS glucose transporter subunit IIA [Lachnospiraceae bacterium]|nr:PTS glucose transporter subunit IIA [Lachnospiraceae bacterium]
MADNRKIAEDVLKAVGGSTNVQQATHCMTRLRLNLKDESIPNDDEVKKIPGVLGVARSGGQYQVIIGQNVPKVYKEVLTMGVRAATAGGAGEEKPKEKLTLKGVGMNILNYLAGSLTPLIPILIGAAMFKTILSIFGPDMLGLFSAESDLFKLFDFVYDAGFYFLPIYVGYTAASKIGASPILGMFMGGILLAPDFLAMAAAEEVTKFTVFGIPAYLTDYSQSVIPIILSVWAMSYVEKFLKKHIPDALSTIFVPFLTILIMLPISLCLLAPLGAYVGQYVSTALISFGNVGGFIAVAVIAAIWEFLVMSGMHVVMVVTVLNIYMTTGYETVIWPAALCATAATFGIALGAFLRIRDKEEKSLSLGYFISGIIGGVTEPALYGIGLKYKKPLIALMIGGAVGGLYVGLTHSYMYGLGATNFLMILSFSGASTANFINGTIGCIISMLAAAAATYFIGFDKNDPVVTGIAVSDDKAADNADQAKDSAAEEVSEVSACISGQVIPASEIKDEVFSQGMMGAGVGIIPDEEVIVAPCDAVVSSVMEESKHAVGLTLANGAEILIHEGLDTVGLGGQGFELYVKEGDKVRKGQKLIRFDKKLIAEKGLDATTVFLLTNSDEYPNAKFETGMKASAADTVVLKF